MATNFSRILSALVKYGAPVGGVAAAAALAPQEAEAAGPKQIATLFALLKRNKDLAAKAEAGVEEVTKALLPAAQITTPAKVGYNAMDDPALVLKLARRYAGDVGGEAVVGGEKFLEDVPRERIPLGMSVHPGTDVPQTFAKSGRAASSARVQSVAHEAAHRAVGDVEPYTRKFYVDEYFDNILEGGGTNEKLRKAAKETYLLDESQFSGKDLDYFRKWKKDMETDAIAFQNMADEVGMEKARKNWNPHTFVT